MVRQKAMGAETARETVAEIAMETPSRSHLE
jgi:hypothetical protein